VRAFDIWMSDDVVGVEWRRCVVEGRVKRSESETGGRGKPEKCKRALSTTGKQR